MFLSSTLSPIVLGCLGVIPFLVSMFLNAQGIELFGHTGRYLFSTYSAIILSFLSGTLWGQCIHQKASNSAVYLLIISNIIAAIAWGALLFHIEAMSIALLLLGFITTFWVEAKYLRHNKNNRARYFNMRFFLTIVVCVLHLLILYPNY